MKVYWYEQTKADVPVGEAWLGATERDRISRMRFPIRRDHWLLGRWTAKNAVAMFLGLETSLATLTEIEILPARSGAPRVFLRDQPAPVSISLSHRSGVALCALAAPGALLGCDLEEVEPHSEAFAADYFCAEEQALVERSPADRDWILSLLWSGKESALKAFGEGLRIDTREAIVCVQGLRKPQHEPSDDPLQCGTVGVPKFPQTHGWHPLEVHRTTGQILQGWWSQRSKLLRTVLAAPPAELPISMGNQA